MVAPSFTMLVAGSLVVHVIVAEVFVSKLTETRLITGALVSGPPDGGSVPKMKRYPAGMFVGEIAAAVTLAGSYGGHGWFAPQNDGLLARYIEAGMA